MTRPLDVLVCGALGKMGRQVVRAVFEAPDLQLVAAVDTAANGEDGLEAAGLPERGLRIDTDLAEAISKSVPAVAVDFTAPEAVMGNVRTCLTRGVAVVGGTTGLSQENLEEISSLCQQYGTPCLFASNFALGAVLMMRFAEQAARYFDHAEIIELHHDEKKDAPSGTALTTAERMLRSRGRPFSPPKAGDPEVKLAGVRGGELGDVRIHSVRVPGVVANQEVIFGSTGQTLTLRHDTTGRECFMPGVLLALRRVRSLEGFVSGLDALLV